MNIEELKMHVRVVLTASLPSVTIQIAPLSENDGDLGVSIFGVERRAVRWVKDIILDLDAELCSGTQFALTPLVRDLETTRKFYPQFLTPWTVEVDLGQACLAEPKTNDQFASLADFVENEAAEWVPVVTPEFYAMASNEELALAA